MQADFEDPSLTFRVKGFDGFHVIGERASITLEAAYTEQFMCKLIVL